MRALPREWEVKTVAMKESRDLNQIELHDFFADLKAYEFEKNSRKEEEDASTSTPTSVTKALVAAEVKPAPAAAKSADQLCEDAMALFMKKFGRFMKNNNHSNSSNFNRNNNKNDSSSNLKCYNCDRPVHFAADCRKPKKDEKKSYTINNKSQNWEGRKPFKKNKEQKGFNELSVLAYDDLH